MKNILLMRHAHALNAGSAKGDKARKLSPEGRGDAAKVGQWCKSLSVSIEFIAHSSAVRTTESAAIVAEQIALTPAAVLPFDELYNAGHETIFETIQALPEGYTTALIVAHNPGISYLVSLCSNGEVSNMSPGTAVLFISNADTWHTISRSDLELVDTIIP